MSVKRVLHVDSTGRRPATYAFFEAKYNREYRCQVQLRSSFKTRSRTSQGSGHGLVYELFARQFFSLENASRVLEGANSVNSEFFIARALRTLYWHPERHVLEPILSKPFKKPIVELVTHLKSIKNPLDLQIDASDTSQELIRGTASQDVWQKFRAC